MHSDPVRFAELHHRIPPSATVCVNMAEAIDLNIRTQWRLTVYVMTPHSIEASNLSSDVNDVTQCPAFANEPSIQHYVTSFHQVQTVLRTVPLSPILNVLLVTDQ